MIDGIYCGLKTTRIYNPKKNRDLLYLTDWERMTDWRSGNIKQNPIWTIASLDKIDVHIAKLGKLIKNNVNFNSRRVKFKRRITQYIATNETIETSNDPTSSDLNNNFKTKPMFSIIAVEDNNASAPELKPDEKYLDVSPSWEKFP